MKKQFLAVILTLSMLISLLPTSALAAEGGEDGEAPVVYTETGEDPEGDPADIPDEPDVGPVEGEGDSTATGPEQEEPAEEPTAAAQLQARINALPDAEALAEMDTEEQAEVCEEVDAIYNAIKGLTDEEVDALDTAKLEEAAAFFTQQITLLDGEDGDGDDTEETVTSTSGICGAPETEGGEVTDSVKWNFDSDTGTLTISGSGAMATFEEKSVVPWNSLKDQITQVVIRDGVTTIGARSFFDCTNITSITIPEGITSIGDHAIRNTSLTSVTIPASVTEIGPCTFAYNEKLTTINVATNNTIYQSIDGVVYKDDGATLAIYPAGRTGDFVIPDGVTAIGNMAFRGNKVIAGVTIPSGVTTIEDSAFYDCWGLTEVTIPEGVTSIAGQTFYRCTSLKNMIIPSNVTTIGESAFNNCTALASVTISEGVTSIADTAFYNCTSLETVTIPSSVTTIGESAFRTCTSLKNVSIPSSVTTIGKSAFMNCTALASVVIPSSMTTIGESVFDNCTTLADVDIHDRVTTIGKKAFYKCAALTSVTIPSSVTTIEEWAFRETGLTSIIIPESVTSIGDRTFYGCKALENVFVPASATSIGQNVFTNCTGLKNISIPEGVSLPVTSGSSVQNSDTMTIYIRGSSASISFGSLPSKPCKAITMGGTIPLTTEFKEKTLASPVKDGYTFDGWYAKDSSGNFTGVAVTTPTTKGTYYAKWNSTISFDANGGTGTMAAQTIAETDTSTILSENTFTRTNYTFSGWNTAADGTGTSYADKATGAGANGNITLYAQWTMKIGGSTNYTVNAIVDQIYTGEEIKPAVVVKTADGYELNANAYTVTYSGDLTNVTSDNADSEKIPTVKVTLNNSDNSATVTFKIIKDENPSVLMNDVDVPYDGQPHAVTATAKTSADNPIEGENIISIMYYTDEDCTKGETSDAPTDAGTYYAKATLIGTDNYAEATTTAKVTINKATFKVSAEGYSDTYDGQPHSITVTPEDADVTVFYCTTEDGDYTSANPTYTNAGEYTVYYKATKANHKDVTGSVSVKITKATLTATYVSETINVGGTPKLEVTVAGFVNGEKADDAADYKAPTVTNSNTAVGNYELKPADGSAKNYQFAYVAGTLTIRSSGNGGGGGSSSGGSTTYTVTVDSTKNGTVTVSPKNASKNTTVTITVKPNSGYEVDDLTVTDKNGDTVRVKDQGNGKYTFTMPASKVTVEASFTKVVEQPSVTFADVPTSAYYADAVAWAVENGITYGTSATTFSPDLACTRAQAVTFLWRAAGSPAPKSRVNPFADVSASAYYYDAVLWAVEQGITVGTSATTFSPDTTCTRGQIVTFLYRAEGTATTGSNPFTDVSNSAYYVDAVKWAVAESVTAGTSATTFSPDASCTRAQIVTFLYRAYA